MSSRSRSRTTVAILAALAAGATALVILVLPHGHAARAPRRPRARTPTHAGIETSGEQFGASVNILFNSGATFSPTEIDAQLAALKASGATVARSDALWELVEPSRPVGGVHHYLWRFDDSIAGALAAHGLEWLPIVDYSAPWTRPAGSGHSPPSSASDFAAYAAALARRYGPGGSFWRSHPELPAMPVRTFEIWNEPDNAAFFSPRPDPARYAEMYLDARTAIDSVDPAARVIVGGLTHPEVFLPALIDAQPALRGELDGIAIHPYAPSAAGVLARVREARAALGSLGLADVPLYITEFGWTTEPAHALNWLPAGRRSAEIASALAALGHTSCGLAAVVLYTWVTLERDRSDREDWYGIHPPGGGENADSAAFATGLRSAAAPAPELQTCSAIR